MLLHHACGVPAECVEAVVEATIRRLDADGEFFFFCSDTGSRQPPALSRPRLEEVGDGLICWGEFEEYYASRRRSLARGAPGFVGCFDCPPRVSRPDELRQLTAHLGLSVNRITARLVMSLDAAGSAHSRPPPRPSAGSASPPPGSRAGLAPPPGPRAPGDTSRVVAVLSVRE